MVHGLETLAFFRLLDLTVINAMLLYVHAFPDKGKVRQAFCHICADPIVILDVGCHCHCSFTIFSVTATQLLEKVAALIIGE